MLDRRARSFHESSLMFKLWLELSKSGIVTLVLISVAAGYFLGHPFDTPLVWGHFFMTLLGVLFLASGSSALNQIQDREMDAQMPRTAKRPLPSRQLTLKSAWTFTIFVLTLGLFLLSQVSLTVLLLGFAAVISYNGLYTPWWKRKWAFAAIPGAIPGALPILMGSVAASGQLWGPASIGGWFLFGILFYWQMPHFWVLALKYRDDYASGGVPTLPVVWGAQITLHHIVIWGLGLVGLSLAAPLFLPVGAFYTVSAIAIGFKLILEMRLLSLYAKQEGPDSLMKGKKWLRFFLWINFALILQLAAAVIDVWSVYLIPKFLG